MDMTRRKPTKRKKLRKIETLADRIGRFSFGSIGNLSPEIRDKVIQKIYYIFDTVKR